MEFINEPIERDNDVKHQSSNELWDYVHYMLNKYGDDVMYHPKLSETIDELKRRGEAD